jgi:hypothetical protein
VVKVEMVALVMATLEKMAVAEVVAQQELAQVEQAE